LLRYIAAGYTYTFTLTAQDAAGAKGSAFVHARANLPPSGGGVGVASGGGGRDVAMTTAFKMVAAGWTDVDAPLLYRFTAHPVVRTCFSYLCLFHRLITQEVGNLTRANLFSKPLLISTHSTCLRRYVEVGLCRLNQVDPNPITYSLSNP
jgi:hypothetical protein